MGKFASASAFGGIKITVIALAFVALAGLAHAADNSSAPSVAPQSNVATSEIPKFITSPCLEGSEAKSGEFGTRPCAVVLPMAEADLKKRLKDQIDGYYLGCNRDMSKPPSDDPNACVGEPYLKESCDIIPGPFNDFKPEGSGVDPSDGDSNGNHISKNCGQWTHLDCEFQKVKKLGIVVGVKTKVTPNKTNGLGMREEALTRGTWIAALTCYHEQVRQEMMAKRINITPSPQGEPKCGAMARSLLDKVNLATSESKELEQRLKGETNLKDIENCGDYQQDASKDAFHFDKARGLRQSACYLKAARAMIESLYESLSACEVFARAEASQLKFLEFWNSPEQETYRTDRLKDVCTNVGGEAQINLCYRRNYLKMFRDKIEPLWPVSGACKMLQ